MKKLIVRIKGGLGNQLFCYAAARRLALVNNVELVLDDVTGFSFDLDYQRHYSLDHFNIHARKAQPIERFEPFSRPRRWFVRWFSQRRPFLDRQYLEQEGNDYDARLLAVKVKGTLYLEGYWQSEEYFKDVEDVIREDLKIIPPTDPVNLHVAEDIQKALAVALHVRWFDVPGSSAGHNVSAEYYQRAIAFMEKNLGAPRYFLFSDNPMAARERFVLPKDRVTLVSHNQGDDNAYADLWLMTQCQHFIIANSTFSWWGAWLGEARNKVIVAPDLKDTAKSSWGFKGLLPKSWIVL